MEHVERSTAYRHECDGAVGSRGAGHKPSEIVSATAFIAQARNADGGYGYQLGNGSDVDTTAFVIQALHAANQDPSATWCANVQCGYLFAQQASDGGFLFWGSPSLYATQEAIPALMHRSFGPRAIWAYNCSHRYFPLIARAFSVP